MKFHSSVLAILSISASLEASDAFSTSKAQNGRNAQSALLSTMTEAAPASETKIESLTHDVISKLQFREAQKELESQQLDASGTLSEMRNRLREAALIRSVGSKDAGEVKVIDQERLNEVCYFKICLKYVSLYV
jgi:hypothetical protein